MQHRVRVQAFLERSLASEHLGRLEAGLLHFQNVAVGAGGLALGLVMASLVTGSAAALILLKTDVTKNLAFSQMPPVCGR